MHMNQPKRDVNLRRRSRSAREDQRQERTGKAPAELNWSPSYARAHHSTMPSKTHEAPPISVPDSAPVSGNNTKIAGIASSPSDINRARTTVSLAE